MSSVGSSSGAKKRSPRPSPQTMLLRGRVAGRVEEVQLVVGAAFVRAALLAGAAFSSVK